MVKHIRTLLLVVAACLCSRIAVAYAPPNYDVASQLEDAYFHAKESGCSASCLFGVEVTHRTFVVSLLAGPGRLSLGSMPYQQLDPDGPMH